MDFFCHRHSFDFSFSFPIFFFFLGAGQSQISVKPAMDTIKNNTNQNAAYSEEFKEKEKKTHTGQMNAVADSPYAHTLYTLTERIIPLAEEI